MATRRSSKEGDELTDDRRARFVDDEGVFAFSLESEEGELVDPATGSPLTEEANQARLRNVGNRYAEQANQQRAE